MAFSVLPLFLSAGFILLIIFAVLWISHR